MKNTHSEPKLFKDWRRGLSNRCDGHFQGFGGLGALLHDVIVDVSKCQGPKGGEKFEKLMNQREDVEYFKYSPGFFTLPCDDGTPRYQFEERAHLNTWMNVMTTGSVKNADEVVDDFTIAITRYEYVNMYHTMTDYYNAFLVMAFLNKTQHQTNILVLDAHPAGGLDSVWGTVFNSMTRVSQLKPRTRFTNLAFGILGYSSPLYVSKGYTQNLPVIDEFREFFLSSYNLPINRPLNCHKLSILLIWRRNYVAHPRNPSGSVHRKIFNEDELQEGIKKHYPDFTVKGVQLDRFDMDDQVKFVAGTDILIGMHGAALSHMLFMPRGRAVIELMPKYITPAWRSHFINMAGGRGLIYKRWVNDNTALEHPDHLTTVPPEMVNAKIAEVVKELCGAEQVADTDRN